MTMKKVVFAIAMIATALMSNESVNAQNLGSEQVFNKVRRVLAKSDIVVDGDTLKNKGIVSEATVKTDLYDKSKFTVEMPVDSNRTAHVSMDEGIRRIILSKGSAGIDAGYMNIGGVSTWAAGAHLTMAWKYLSVTPGFLLGYYKMNQESNRPGQGYMTQMVYCEAGGNIRFPMGGFNNHQLIELGIGVMYIFKKNSNDVSSNTYISGNQLVTEKSEFRVEGNATSFYLYAKWRFAFKHMGITGGSIKGMGGITREYYKFGSESEWFFGGIASFDLSFSKKHTDKDVEWFQNSLEMGNQRVVNEFVNQLRATVK